MSINELLYSQDGVCTRQQVLALGLSDDFIRQRIERGVWMHLCPGVFLSGTGPVSEEQAWRASLLACGPRSMLTGVAGMRAHGVRIDRRPSAEVLLPHDVRRSSTPLYLPVRSRNCPRPIDVGGLAVAPIDVATIHACRGVVGIRNVRAILAASVQQRKCDAGSLIAAAARSGRVRALVRAGLKEIKEGVRSVPEGDLRRLIMQTSLPMPIFNPTLLNAAGEVIAVPDAYWELAGVALEVESKEYHFYEGRWQHTMKVRSHMSSYGILVVQAPPSRISTDRTSLLADIERTYATGLARGPLGLTVLPA